LEAWADPYNTGRAERGRRVRDAEVAERAERSEDDEQILDDWARPTL
jgi:hypothetical protein